MRNKFCLFNFFSGIIMLAMVLTGCSTTNNAQTTEEKSVKVNYSTVTEGFDWGPAITKLVLDLGEKVNGESLSKDLFKVEVNRRYKGFDFATFQPETEASDHIAARNVIDVYTSNEDGNRVSDGNYVTIEMEVGPDLTEGSPFNFDFMKFLNSYVETSYNVELLGKIGSIVAIDEMVKIADKSLIADDFNNNQKFNYNDISLTYASYKPDSASAKNGSNPLIIWLHGAGEGGTDTRIALLGNKVVNLATEDIQQYFGNTGSYILAPQSPTMWMDTNGKGVYVTDKPEESLGESYYTEALMALITDFVDSNPEIDKNRIYIGGCSNGGYMTINMLKKYPEYFAAAYPAAEAYMSMWLSDDDINRLKNIPIWLTQAKVDPTVVVAEGEPGEGFGQINFVMDDKGNPVMKDEFANALYRRVTEAGGTKIHYSLFDKVIDTTGLYKNKEGDTYEYNGHWSWVYTLNNECVESINGKELTIFEWLSMQKK